MTPKSITAVLLLFLASAAYCEEPVVGSEFRFDLGSSGTRDFGPFFIPMDPGINSVSLYYYTSEPQVTSVNFCMVGELDWLRNDYRKTSFHRMDFREVEVATTYRFRVRTDSSNIEQNASIRTMPYGDVYSFRFAIANAESDFELNSQVDFLVLASSNTSWRENSVAEFYDRHRSVLSQTVLVPMFDMNIAGSNVTLSRNGVYLVKYKKVNLICIIHASGIRYVESLISYDVKDKNMIVFGNIAPADIETVVRNTSGRIDAYYSVRRIDNPAVQVIEKAFVLEATSDNVSEVRSDSVDSEVERG